MPVARFFSPFACQFVWLRLLVEAIRYPGFALLQILSPCVTYRPEEKDWKHQVHAAGVEATADPVEAARRLFADDGMTTGVFYRAERPLYPAAVNTAATTLTTLEAGLAL